MFDQKIINPLIVLVLANLQIFNGGLVYHLILNKDHNYETSAFAQTGKVSRHNMNYWLFGDYVGIGAGAHSKISFADRILRQMRYKQPKEF